MCGIRQKLPVRIKRCWTCCKSLIIFDVLGFFSKGVISTTRADLDRENQSTYEIIVKAKDGPGSSGDSSTATVIITLSDINDNFPVFKHRKYNASAVSFGNQGLAQP